MKDYKRIEKDVEGGIRVLFQVSQKLVWNNSGVNGNSK
jgi:hypothetical protein